jgi:hypothetical protein
MMGQKLLALLVLVLVMVTVSMGAVPGIISFQGVLEDDQGTPLDGTYTVTFSIYTLASGGSALWSETMDVTCSDGLFSVLLGLTSPMDLDFSEQYYLGFTLSGENEMMPRYRLATAPYAFYTAVAESAIVASTAGGVEWSDISDIPAGFADGVDDEASGAGGWVDDGSTVRLESSGDAVGIGTSSPDSKLHVQGTLQTGTDGNGSDVMFYGQNFGSGFVWNQEKMAIRAGLDGDGTHWAPDSVGQYSLGVGSSTKARGHTSVALGSNASATGSASVAMGSLTEARGDYSTAMGSESVASGSYSTASGSDTRASGDYSLAAGRESAAKGWTSIAGGEHSVAGGTGSVALGSYLRAGPADHTIALGIGPLPDSLVNNVANSMMVGFYDTTATLFVGGTQSRVGIGTTAPSEKLDVNGTAMMTGFKMPTSASSGHVLTSDGSGVGTWQPVSAAADSDWTISGSDMYSNVSGNVGIGTTTPYTYAKLHVMMPGTGSYDRLTVESPTNDVGFGIELRNTTDAWRIGMNIGNHSDGRLGFYHGSHRLLIMPDGRVGIGSDAVPSAVLDVQGTVEVGSDTSGYDVKFYGAESGGMFLWDEEKMALRAGRDEDGTFWSPDSIGEYSFAAGRDTRAIGRYSFAVGRDSWAKDDYCVAMGDGCEATDEAAVALGYDSWATGEYSLAAGEECTAGGYAAVALGYDSDATGDYATAIGNGAGAGGYGSVAMGGADADADFSTALGIRSEARGDYSVAIGSRIRADSASAFVIGTGLDNMNPLVNGIENSLVVGFGDTAATLFVGGANNRVGIGTRNPGNALSVIGNIFCSGKLHAGGGVDPPYVLYDFETRDAIVERVADEVPDEKLNGAVLFWNGPASRFEVYLPDRGEFRDLQGNLLEDF